MVSSSTIERVGQVQFEYRSDYLFVSIESGDASLDERREVWQNIATEYKHHRYTKVLVLENSSERLSTADAFQLASEIPFMGFGGGRSAYVDKDIAGKDLADFGQTVAANRGLNCAVFNSVDEAERWLRKR